MHRIIALTLACQVGFTTGAFAQQGPSPAAVERLLAAMATANTSLLRVAFPRVRQEEDRIRTVNPQFAWETELAKFGARFAAAVRLEDSELNTGLTPSGYAGFVLSLTSATRREVMEVRPQAPGVVAWVKLYFGNPALSPSDERVLLKERVFRLFFSPDQTVSGIFSQPSLDVLWPTTPPRVLSVRVRPLGPDYGAPVLELKLLPNTTLKSIDVHFGALHTAIDVAQIQQRGAYIRQPLGIKSARETNWDGVTATIVATTDAGLTDSVHFTTPAVYRGESLLCFVRESPFPGEPEWLQNARARAAICGEVESWLPLRNGSPR